ncbi:MAG: hypothetical protein AAF433_17310 [Bacteroidota bacterium]
MFKYLSLLSLSLLFVLACSPKTTTTVTAPEPTPTTPSEAVNLRCASFDDARDPDRAADSYVIYRNFVRSQEYELALERWRYVYENAPAADGQRNTVFTDGIFLYNHLIQENPDKKEAYADTILMLYQQADECFPDNSYIIGLQGFDSYYTYPGSATDEEVYALFKRSIELDEEEFPYFVINPMSALVYKMASEEKISVEEAKWVTGRLTARLDKGLAECEENGDCATWGLISGYTPGAIELFESVKGFYDCDYFVEKYYPEFEAEPDNLEVVTRVLGRMTWAECAEDMEEYATAYAAYVELTRVDPPSGPCSAGYNALRNNEYEEGIGLLEECAAATEDGVKKAQVLMAISNTYYRLRNFRQSRNYARQAAQANPNWGRPYLMIGRLYASSGPLCGPGTGFDSQVVVWVALDQWNRAKRVDPSMAGEANALINRYRQYMPFREDIFQRGIEMGSTFTVGCWINESTIVRTNQ